MSAIEQLCNIIENCKIYNIGNYKYFVFPFKGIYPIDIKFLNKTVKMMESKISSKSKKILTIMVDGVILALPIALETNKQLLIARDYGYRLPKICSFTQKTRYYERDMYFGGINSSDKIEIVDAVISSGGTVIKLIEKVEKLGAEVIGIHTMINKVDYGGVDIIRDSGYKVFSLLDVKIQGKKISCNASKN